MIAVRNTRRRKQNTIKRGLRKHILTTLVAGKKHEAELQVVQSGVERDTKIERGKRYMTLQYYKVDPNYKREQSFICPNNPWVMCSVKNCYRCGWNPTVAEMRLEKIRKEMRQKNGQK